MICCVRPDTFFFFCGELPLCVLFFFFLSGTFFHSYLLVSVLSFVLCAFFVEFLFFLLFFIFIFVTTGEIGRAHV